MHRNLATLSASMLLTGCATIASQSSAFSTLRQVGEVDERYLSYNVEMVEVTGGRFWRPYGSAGTERYEYRPPLDLTDGKLRRLAAALAPAYVRVSGTWANATWFADTDEPPEKAPAGFDTVLTRQQWRGVVDFTRAVDGKIVTSVATSPGTRDANGIWQPDMSARLFAYTRSIGGTIAASEFANEPNMLWLTQPPAGYTAAAYRRDYARFAGWLRQTSPGTALLAPGVAELGEPTRTIARRNKERVILEADQLITADSPRPDGFSFHYYGGGSVRCGGAALGMTVENALSPKWLNGVDAIVTDVVKLRDQVAPGVPLWNTESAESSCGGNPWAATFADSFRFVDTLGRSALQGVHVYIHNTLSASDYALLEEHGNVPRPNYWAAVLWKRTMGTTVLAAPASPAPDLRLYAHCSVDRKGGVTLVAVNIGDSAQVVPVGERAQSWVLQSANGSLDTKAIQINGHRPRADDAGELYGLEGAPVSGTISVPGKAIAFVKVTNAGNPNCR
jgi:heparanase 1